MLKFFLRLFLPVVAGFAVACWLALEVQEHRFANAAETFHHEAVRGQVYSLVEQLRPLPAAARERELARIAPHYGLSLALLTPGSVAVSPDEAARLAAGRFIARDDYGEYIAPVPGNSNAPLQWLRLRLPPGPYLSPAALAATCLVIVLVVGGFVLAWAWPTWRDLEALKRAAQRMGDGDLGARTRISPRSSVYRLASDFDQMRERIAALVASQRDLSNAVSHEMRTPVSRLTFELDMLARETNPAARQALIGEMHDDLRELDALVGSWLAYARLEQRGARPALSAVPARDWLDGVLARVRHEAQAAGVNCRVVACGMPDIAIDARSMTHALLNLLRNAVRYAASQVEVGLTRDAAGNMLLSVADDGPGIAPADRARIFEPFTRLDESRQRATGGFGLGLAIVRRVARWHGGEVEVDDSRLGGARFLLQWPSPAINANNGPNNCAARAGPA